MVVCGSVDGFDSGRERGDVLAIENVFALACAARVVKFKRDTRSRSLNPGL